MFHVEWTPRLIASGDDWSDLARRAIEPNVFHEPDFVCPAVEFLGPDTGQVAIRDAARRLVGVLPLRRRPFRLATWMNPYAPDGTVLIDRDDPDAVLEAVFRHLAATPGAPSLLHLPLFPRTGPLAAAVRRVAAAMALPVAELDVHGRACLARGAGELGSGLRRKQQKEAARQRRRLAESGALQTELCEGAEAVTAALDDFLKLEKSGWKGRAGTAMDVNEGSRSFVLAAIPRLAASGRARIVALKSGASTIASAIVLGGSDRSWFWKIAYDERFARASPGVQITLDLTTMLGACDGPVLTDSCAASGHPMIESIWRERREFSDLIVLLRPRHRLRFAIAVGIDSRLRVARAVARRLRDFLRRGWRR